jgi:biopolymer transport protein ExbB/TolQ
MKVLPLLFPSLIEAGGPEGTRALWLLVMSWVMWALMTWGVVAVVLASGAHRVLGVWVFGTEASRLERRREVSAAGARAARVRGWTARVRRGRAGGHERLPAMIAAAESGRDVHLPRP